MANIAGKPKGYFTKILAIDCETTGLCFNTDDPSYNPETGEEHQAISWGLVVADAATLKPIEELYVEIQWNGDSTWTTRAEEVHGLSKEYLEKNGVSEEEAVALIGSLILKHWGPNVSVRTLGHNVTTFDVWFLKRLMRRHDIELSFGSRHVDTSSIGFVNWGTFNSDDLFEITGVVDKRKKHNALDDAKFALEAARRTRILFNTLFEE